MLFIEAIKLLFATSTDEDELHSTVVNYTRVTVGKIPGKKKDIFKWFNKKISVTIFKFKVKLNRINYY